MTISTGQTQSFLTQLETIKTLDDFEKAFPSSEKTLDQEIRNFKPWRQNRETLDNLINRISSAVECLRQFERTNTLTAEQALSCDKVIKRLTHESFCIAREMMGKELSSRPVKGFFIGAKEESKPTTFAGSLSEGCRTMSQWVTSWVITPPAAKYCKEIERTPEDYLDTVRYMVQAPGSRLTSRHLYDFIVYLENDFPEKNKLVFLSSAITNNKSIEHRSPSEQIIEYSKNWTLDDKDFIFIPFVYKGSDLPGIETGHLVLIVVSYRDKTVEYYDPYGHPPGQWDTYASFSMEEDLKKVRELCFPECDESEILILTNKLQRDNHSCGVIGIDIMVRRAEGTSFEQINRLNYGDPQQVRVDLARLLSTAQ